MSMFMRDVGSGPAVLMLHGAPTPAELFAPLAQRLGQRFRVLMPDLPGYGSTPVGDGSIEGVNRMLVAALAERGVHELHGVVGFCSGFYRGLFLALRGGLRVRVLAGVGAFANLDDETRGMFRNLAAMLERDPAQLDTPDIRALAAQRCLSAGFRAAHPAKTDEVGRWVQIVDVNHFATEVRAFAESPDLREELASLSSELYLRVGAEDTTAPPAWSHEIALRVRGARVDVVTGCGHALFVEDAMATDAALEQALVDAQVRPESARSSMS